VTQAGTVPRPVSWARTPEPQPRNVEHPHHVTTEPSANGATPSSGAVTPDVTAPANGVATLNGTATPDAGVAPAVVVDGLIKRYGELEAVRGIDFAVQAGETFGFLGPNGAGKSTTISMLCTLVQPSGGSARVADHDVVRERDEVRRNIGLVFQDTTLDGYLSAEQNLRLHAELYGMPRGAVSERLQQVMEMVGLWERRASLVMTFSGGMKRRLEIARGLLHSPRVLFLDEPTVGLDPQTRSSIWNYISELKRDEDITIFLTTHYMDEAEYCDRIAIIDRGTIVALDTPQELKASVGHDRVQIQTGDDEAAIAALSERFQIEASVAEGAVTFGVPAGEQFVPRLFSELGQEIHSVNVSRPSLDDVFMSYTGTTIRDAEESGMTDMRRNMARMMSR
jgi:ABC-2 type transport system ATP-binding protein